MLKPLIYGFLITAVLFSIFIFYKDILGFFSIVVTKEQLEYVYWFIVTWLFCSWVLWAAKQ